MYYSFLPPLSIRDMTDNDAINRLFEIRPRAMVQILVP
jgi:hypothetical protein